MIIEYISGDLLDHDGPIAHGVNCQGVMASGVAKVIREKWPEFFAKFHKTSKLYAPEELLGKIDFVYTTLTTSGEYEDSPYFLGCNLYTQLNYGREGYRYASYDAIAKCFESLNLRHDREFRGKVLGIPKIGAGLGGGDWSVIESIINSSTPDLNIVVYVL